MGIGPAELLLILIVFGLGGVALLVVPYWIVRLAVRHALEDVQRSRTQVPRPPV